MSALFCGLGRSKKKRVGVYLSGVSREDGTRSFQNSLSGESLATVRNWYMEEEFGETRMAPIGVTFNSILIAAAAVMALIGMTLV